MCREETKYQVLQVSSSPSGPHCVSASGPASATQGQMEEALHLSRSQPTHCDLPAPSEARGCVAGHFLATSDGHTSSPLGLGGPEGNGHNLARPDDSGQSAFHLEHYKPPSAGPLTLYQHPHTMVTGPRPRPGCRLVLKKLVAHDSSR